MGAAGVFGVSASPQSCNTVVMVIKRMKFVSNFIKQSVAIRQPQLVHSFELIQATRLTWDWHNEFINYLQKGALPEHKKAARQLSIRAARSSFWLT